MAVAYVECRPLSISLLRNGSTSNTIDCKGGGTRGKTFGMTRQSAARARNFINQLDPDRDYAEITLTYPEEYPRHISVAQGHEKSILAKICRRWPDAFLMSVLQLQVRGAPHYHILLHGASVAELRSWIPGAWAKTVGSDDPSHLKAGTSVGRVRNLSRYRQYVCRKWTASEVERAKRIYPDGLGRLWKTRNQNAMPRAAVQRFELSEKQCHMLNRIFRQYARTWASGGRYNRYFRGEFRNLRLSISDPDSWVRLLENIGGERVPVDHISDRSVRNKSKPRGIGGKAMPSRTIGDTVVHDGVGFIRWWNHDCHRSPLTMGVSIAPRPINMLNARQIRPANDYSKAITQGDTQQGCDRLQSRRYNPPYRTRTSSRSQGLSFNEAHPKPTWSRYRTITPQFPTGSRLKRLGYQSYTVSRSRQFAPN